MLFAALVPSIVKGMTARTEPFAMWHLPNFPPLRSIVSACTVLTALIVWHVTVLRDTSDKMMTFDEILCL